MSLRKAVCRGNTFDLEREVQQSGDRVGGSTDLEPKCAFISLKNVTFDFLLFGTGLHVRFELANVIVLRSIVLVQHLNPEFRVTRDVLDLPKFVPYGLQCVGLDGRTVGRGK